MNPNIATMIAARRAKKVPIADNPDPGPIYASAGRDKRQPKIIISPGNVGFNTSFIVIRRSAVEGIVY